MKACINGLVLIGIASEWLILLSFMAIRWPSNLQGYSLAKREASGMMRKAAMQRYQTLQCLSHISKDAKGEQEG